MALLGSGYLPDSAGMGVSNSRAHLEDRELGPGEIEEETSRPGGSGKMELTLLLAPGSSTASLPRFQGQGGSEVPGKGRGRTILVPLGGSSWMPDV